jgi:hypothetical protein
MTRTHKTRLRWAMLWGACSAGVAFAVLQPIPSTAIKPFADYRTYVLVQDVAYSVGSSNITITVPAGFVTDLASIPQAFWSLGLSPTGRYSKAAIVHDYLYWTQLCTRRQADNILLIAMKESLVPAVTRDTIFQGVRAAGSSAWSDNAKEKAKGLPKIIPASQWNFGPQVLWKDYQLQLKAQGVKDPTPPPETYCALGNSTDVPQAAK